MPSWKLKWPFFAAKLHEEYFSIHDSLLIPISLLILLSFGQINNLISKHQNDQLKQTNKQYGITVLDRLLLLKSQLDWIAQNSRQQDLPISLIENSNFKLKLDQGFKNIGILTEINEPEFLIGQRENIKKLIESEHHYLKAANTILTSDVHWIIQRESSWSECSIPIGSIKALSLRKSTKLIYGATSTRSDPKYNYACLMNRTNLCFALIMDTNPTSNKL